MSQCQYRKKPVVIEAMRCDNETTPSKVAFWCGGRIAPHPERSGVGEPMVVFIDTLEGTMMAEPGDYIIKGVKGEFYPCKLDIFDATYEPVEEGAAP